MFQVTCSVRTLVEFVYLCGDIDRGFSDVKRALDGARIHRQLQKSSTYPYEAEVFLRHTTVLDDITFQVEGRADGVIHRDGAIIIDEIKTTYAPYDEITIDFQDVHWAQAMCYAYFYCVDHVLDKIIVQLTYYQMETHQIKQFEKVMEFETLKAFYLDILEQYRKWAILAKEHRKVRQMSIRSLQFPFPSYREGQRDLAVATYKTILDKEVLFAQAPTGIGKTISTMFPSIKALGEEKADRLFYLSAKTITQNVAVDALSKMRVHGLHIKSVVISAKEKCCFMDVKNCDPEVCPYAKGYYDRLHDAMYEILKNEDHYDLELVKRYGEMHSLCPFELSLDLSLYCDVIICDYNYVFDPQVYLKRFFQEQQERIVLLVDEAHNLVDRARNMFTKQLSLSLIQEAYRALPKEQKVLRRSVKKLSSCMQVLFEEMKHDFETMEAMDPAIHDACLQVIELGEVYRKEHRLELSDPFDDLYFDINAFLRIEEMVDDHFLFTLQNTGDFIYELYCLDPSSMLSKRMKEVTATMLFSATLSPVSYFEMLLTGNTNNRKLMLRSPFPKEHLAILLDDQISTRYKDRNITAKEIVELIVSSVSMKDGNYMVFFPSYQYLEQIYTLFHTMYPNILVKKQEIGMSEKEKQAFLELFETTRDTTLIGFCVLGGMYGEGIDLRNDALIGSIIVSVGLPQINPHQELLKEYFEDRMQMGFAYAYICPGMGKVLQACGRVIRSENDKGMILLIDDRYRLPAWNHLLPPHYQHYERVSNHYDVMKQLKEFWKE